MGVDSWIKPADVAMELLSRSEVVEGVVRGMAQAVRGFAVWLGDEAYTPRTGPPPYVSPSRPGTWSGVVVVHRNQVVSWILLPSGDATDRHANNVEQRHHIDPFEDDGLFEGHGPRGWADHR